MVSTPRQDRARASHDEHTSCADKCSLPVHAAPGGPLMRCSPSAMRPSRPT